MHMSCDEMLVKVQLSELAQPHTDMAAEHKQRIEVMGIITKTFLPFESEYIHQ